MAENLSLTEQILALARTQGVLRVRDLTANGLHPEGLRRLHKQGRLTRISRGMYALPDAEMTEHRSLVEACKQVPAGVICLLSALQFHGLTTQLPFEVWLIIDRKAHAPKTSPVPLRVFRASGLALTHGVEVHQIEGVAVQVYSAAKTVADCFKYRNKIGLDVALEALRDYRRKYRGGGDDLWRAAQVCRVGNVMRPYLEALS